MPISPCLCNANFPMLMWCKFPHAYVMPISPSLCYAYFPILMKCIFHHPYVRHISLSLCNEYFTIFMWCKFHHPYVMQISPSLCNAYFPILTHVQNYKKGRSMYKNLSTNACLISLARSIRCSGILSSTAVSSWDSSKLFRQSSLDKV